MSFDLTDAIVEVIEKAALLRVEIERRGDQEAYAARLSRVAAKIEALAARAGEDDPKVAEAIRMAWQRPIRTLAFRNAEHRKNRP